MNCRTSLWPELCVKNTAWLATAARFGGIVLLKPHKPPKYNFFRKCGGSGGVWGPQGEHAALGPNLKAGDLATPGRPAGALSDALGSYEGDPDAARAVGGRKPHHRGPPRPAVECKELQGGFRFKKSINGPHTYGPQVKISDELNRGRCHQRDVDGSGRASSLKKRQPSNEIVSNQRKTSVMGIRNTRGRESGPSARHAGGGGSVVGVASGAVQAQGPPHLRLRLLHLLHGAVSRRLGAHDVRRHHTGGPRGGRRL